MDASSSPSPTSRQSAPQPSGASGPFFSDVFHVDRSLLAAHGSFDISLVNDLPLFIDPFLLFHSARPEYQLLHEKLIAYIRFLRDRSADGCVGEADLRYWYCFPEVRQNWLGFSVSGNRGSGLGLKFARDLHRNLNLILSNFGRERITAGSHIEKVGLMREGIGRDNISDFVTNLIIGWLCEYTESFARQHIEPHLLKEVWIDRAAFNPETEAWERRRYTLPFHRGDHVILTPRDILARDTTWINRADMLDRIEELPATIGDSELRAAISNYLWKRLAALKPPDRVLNRDVRAQAAADTVREFPDLVDYYIKLKEDSGDRATLTSAERVVATELIFSEQVRRHLLSHLGASDAFRRPFGTHAETMSRLLYLKHVIEDKGGWRIFYHQGVAIEREATIQILFKLVWFGTQSDCSAEVNDGRGPADFKVSRGREKTIVEFKLAANRKLEANLGKQAAIYQSSADAQTAIYAIVYPKHRPVAIKR